MSKSRIDEPHGALPPDFLDFILSLNEHKVDFVLVGGYALAIHGVPRATGDIDFLYRSTPKNVKRLCAALAAFGAPANVIDEAGLREADTVTQFGQRPHRIDLLSAIDGVTFQEVWSGAERTSIDGAKLRVIGLTELEKNKAATGRQKDRSDLRRLNPKRWSKKHRD